MRSVLCIAIFVIGQTQLIYSSGTSCRFNERNYAINERWSFEVRNKIFNCHCKPAGYAACDWSTKPAKRPDCYDRSSRTTRKYKSTWTIIRNERTLDCNCSQSKTGNMVIECSGHNRCHYEGVSYQKGNTWNSSDVTGLLLNCHCLGAERVTCKGSVTRETPKPVADAQWIEDHIVLGKQVLRPRIATLQACDTGTRVVSSGHTWNQTNVENGQSLVKRCVCRDALIHCERYFASRISEPHCLSDEGHIKRIGEDWITIHPHHKNIRTQCNCVRHGVKKCRDVGYCADPKPPVNGAIVCITKGQSGSSQKYFCKPLCRPGFDFPNKQRYRRIWEVCSKVTYHRWSGGYADDSLMLAKCRESNQRGWRPSLYLPSSYCEDLTPHEINSIKRQFLRELEAQNLCTNTCESKPLRCGPVA